MPEGKGILFLTLRVFSATGGIEKVSRQVGKALYELSHGQAKDNFTVLSMYDDQKDINEKYFPASIFKGYAQNKWWFLINAILKGMQKDTVILSHINLLLAGYCIKLLSPKTKLVLMAHGIEVWEPLSSWKKRMLNKCDQLFTVSNFTKHKIMEKQGYPEHKLKVLNNCLDPFLPLPAQHEKQAILMERYQVSPGDIVLMTLTRLSSKEKYKGYDTVLYSVKELKAQYPTLKYLIGGKYDTAEKNRLDTIIGQLGLQEAIIFPGFIAEEELSAHFQMADIYIMPSKKEGFGIVFIEALYYGKPVIAGNKDGSADALCNGKFGLLVNPDESCEITNAIATVLADKNKYIPKLQEVTDKFSFSVYKENLEALLKIES